MNIINMKNLTESDIVFGSVILTPGDNIVFDVNNPSTYRMSRDLLFDFYDAIVSAVIDERVLDFIVDNVSYTSRVYFGGFYDAMRILNEDIHLKLNNRGNNRFYFELDSRKLCIKCPLTGKTFGVTLTEITQ